MVRVPRHRTSSSTLVGSSASTTDGIAGVATPKSITNSSSCDDSIGRPVVNSAFLSSQVRNSLRLNGSATSSPSLGHTHGIRYDNWPVTYADGGTNTAALSYPVSWYLDTVARTNPSRPVLTPATLIQDFVELPAMVRHIGSLLTKRARTLGPKDLASQNLALQFGWLPLIQDLNTLLNLQAHVLRRTRELQKLYSGSGLRRKVMLAEDHVVGANTLRLFSYFSAGIDLRTDIHVSKKVWATIRWRPTSPPSYHPSDSDLNHLARRIVLGLTPEGLTKGLWDVIPWTWLLGWFSSVGNYLLSYSNTVPASHSDACVMNETTVVITGRVVNAGLASCDVNVDGSYYSCIKRRAVSGALTAGFNMPFISMFRLSILGSLYVQRFSR